jgi:hypothetical protein
VEQSADFAAGCASTTVQAEFPFDIGQILMLTVYVIGFACAPRT